MAVHTFTNTSDYIRQLGAVRINPGNSADIDVFDLTQDDYAEAIAHFSVSPPLPPITAIEKEGFGIITPDQNAALDAANSPSAANAIATMADISGAPASLIQDSEFVPMGNTNIAFVSSGPFTGGFSVAPGDTPVAALMHIISFAAGSEAYSLSNPLGGVIIGQFAGTPSLEGQSHIVPTAGVPFVSGFISAGSGGPLSFEVVGYWTST